MHCEESYKQQIDDVLSRHSGDRGELIPILQELEEEIGYIPREAIRRTAEHLGINESAVYGVVTFYAQFHLTRQGKHRIKVCQGTACHVRGAGQLLLALKKSIGIDPGATTDDYRYSLERVACFGSCALGPVMLVNDAVHGRMTPDRVDDILEQLE